MARTNITSKSFSSATLVLTALIGTLFFSASGWAQDADNEDFFIVPDSQQAGQKPGTAAKPSESAQGNESWYNLLYKVYTTGLKTELTEYTSYYFQKGTSFDTSVNREVQYFTLTVKIDFLGNIQPTSVSTVKEKWTKIESGWHVDQLIRVSDLQGGLRQVYDAVLTFTKEGVVSNRVLKPVPSVSSKEMQDAWEKDKARWIAEFAPSQG